MLVAVYKEEQNLPQSVSLFVTLNVSFYLYLSLYLSVFLSACQSLWLPVSLSFYRSVQKWKKVVLLFKIELDLWECPIMCLRFSLIQYISSLPLLNPTNVRDHLLGLRPRLTRSWLKCINAPWSVLCSGDPTLLDLTKLSKQLNVPFSIREGLTKAIKVSGKA